MAQLRIKGQECAFKVIEDGDLVDVLPAIASFDFEIDQEVLQEEYVGETSDRYDSIFHGVNFNVSAHMENQSELALTERLVLKAQRRTGGAARVDIAITYIYPNGQTRIITQPMVISREVPM